MSQANIQLVKEAFEAFFNGDVPGFVERTDPSVEWDHRGPDGVPFNKTYKGREGVVEFFQTIDETLGMDFFDLEEFFSAGDRVAVTGRFGWKVKSTGKSYESDFTMLFTVENGLVTHWKPIFDKTAEQLAFQA